MTVDPTGRTSVDGVWAAGNVAYPMAQVITAAAAGARAAVDINGALVTADTDLAVRHAADPFGAASEAARCVRVLGERRHGLTTG